MIKNILISIIIGTLLFFGWHYLFGLTWSREASFDILSGAILEFFIFQMLMQLNNRKHMNQMNQYMEAHLRKIEYLLKKNDDEF